ncbi:MAG TPA: aminotransferase class III-fold pyridoxal phosphate-dependent enzyme, partial [Acidimicrobiia bacterium]
ALKVARAYHLANGEPQRAIVIGREISYHGNTRGALDVSGRASLREPYLPWLGAAGRVPGVLEYRCPNPDHPESCATWHAARLEDEIARLGRDQVAAFIAEPVGGAASGAAAPPQGYWEAMTEVCRSHGVLVIADEVMTGFGRTGRWFASEHFGLVPDVMTLAKGASSGYWPLGVCAFSGRITQALRSAGFIHGLTFSHHPVGAAVGLAVIAAIEELSLVEAARVRGAELLAELAGALSAHPHVGDVRGLGLMIAVELVEDRDSKRPFPTSADVAANAALLCREQGLLVYPSTGCAGGGRGDLLMIGPPLTISRDEVALITSMLPRALERL